MEKFLLDTNNLDSCINELLDLQSELKEFRKMFYKYNGSSSNEHFDVNGAFNAIWNNLEGFDVKIFNTAKLFDNVLEKHLEFQDSYKGYSETADSHLYVGEEKLGLVQRYPESKFEKSKQQMNNDFAKYMRNIRRQSMETHQGCNSRRKMVFDPVYIDSNGNASNIHKYIPTTEANKPVHSNPAVDGDMTDTFYV